VKGDDQQPIAVKPDDAETDDDDKTLDELRQELNLPWDRFLKLVALPIDANLFAEMTLREARGVVRYRKGA